MTVLAGLMTLCLVILMILMIRMIYELHLKFNILKAKVDGVKLNLNGMVTKLELRMLDDKLDDILAEVKAKKDKEIINEINKEINQIMEDYDL